MDIFKVFPTLPTHHLNMIVRHIVRKSTEKVQQSSDHDFNECIRKDRKRFYFKQFAIKECSVEPLFLYEEVLQFKGIHKDFKIEKAKRIYSIFLDEKGTLTVNTDTKHVQEIKEIIDLSVKYHEFPPDNLFDNLVKDLKGVMIDSYLRFKSDQS